MSELKVEVVNTTNEKKIEFNPNKNYQWKLEDQFVLNGPEFGLLMNGLRAFLTTENAINVLTISKASEILEKKLKDAVELGIAFEVNEQNNQNA